MLSGAEGYEVRLAATQQDRAAAQRLRYRVFVEEMGADATPEQHALRQEGDRFDPYFDHLLLIDRGAEVADPLDRVVGVYRLMRGEAAEAGIGFYGAGEYDLSMIAQSGRRCVELGRSCVAKEHRSGLGIHLLWNGLAEYVFARDIEILFGVASFHGTDPEPLAEALSLLRHRYLAPEDIRVRAVEGHYLAMDLVSPEEIDPARALRVVPPLIRAYLRQGGVVGDGAFIDHDFNTIDVCVILDTARMVKKYRAAYERNRRARG